MRWSKGGSAWTLREVILVCLVAVLFGVVYLGAVYASSGIGTLLVPIGLGEFTYEVIFGVWFMAATLIGYLLRRPGVAVVTELLAALLEVLMGNFFGPVVLISGLVQGLGAELGFAVFRYRRWDLISLCAASCGCAVASFAWGFYRSGFTKLEPGLLISMFLVRLLSSCVFAGWLSKRLGDELVNAGVVRVPRTIVATEHV